MLFRLFLTERQLYLGILGAVGVNGKIYFSCVNVALVIGMHKINEWAKEFGSCKLVEILPDCGQPFADTWVIERTALFHLLSYRMASGFRADKESRLYESLERGHVRFCGQVYRVLHWDTCSNNVGKPLKEYLMELQEKWV